MEITAANLSEIVSGWMSKSILTNDVEFSEKLNQEAINTFIFDYKRYFPTESQIQLSKLEE